jgi:hypothetical protein
MMFPQLDSAGSDCGSYTFRFRSPVGAFGDAAMRNAPAGGDSLSRGRGWFMSCGGRQALYQWQRLPFARILTAR